MSFDKEKKVGVGLFFFQKKRKIIERFKWRQISPKKYNKEKYMVMVHVGIDHLMYNLHNEKVNIIYHHSNSIHLFLKCFSLLMNGGISHFILLRVITKEMILPSCLCQLSFVMFTLPSWFIVSLLSRFYNDKVSNWIWQPNYQWT